MPWRCRRSPRSEAELGDTRAPDSLGIDGPRRENSSNSRAGTHGKAVKDRKGNIHFSRLLKYMLKDGLTDQNIPMVRRYGGSAIGFVNGDIQKRWLPTSVDQS